MQSYFIIITINIINIKLLYYIIVNTSNLICVMWFLQEDIYGKK